ncbi:hypothetical protein Tco_1340397 [Tanacetum coccineum]
MLPRHYLLRERLLSVREVQGLMVLHVLNLFVNGGDRGLDLNQWSIIESSICMPSNCFGQHSNCDAMKGETWRKM